MILLVVSPLTGKLRLDEQISSMFRSISLYNDTADLKSQLWEMDDKRLDRIMGKYEEAVEQDVAAMAAADGFACVNARVQIDSDTPNLVTFSRIILVIVFLVLYVKAGAWGVDIMHENTA